MISVAPASTPRRSPSPPPAVALNAPSWVAIQPAAVSPARRHTTTHSTVLLTVTHRAVRVIWWLVLVVQALNALHLTSLSFVYLSYASAADSVLRYLAICFLTTPQQAFLSTFGMFIGVVYGGLGALFVWSTLTMIVGSLWNRRSSFALPDRRVSSSLGPRAFKSSIANESSLQPLSARTRSVSVFLERVSGAWLYEFRERVVRAWIACGVRGLYFDQAMLVRETIELFYQAVQADQVSRRISHRAINHAYTALIAANALLHPVLSYVFRHDPPMRRFAVVFSDFFLDFLWGCVLPLWMLWPYLQLDRAQSTMRLFLANGFGSIENAQREVEQLVILSWSALLLTVLPFVSALLSLRSVKKLLSSARRIVSWSEVTQAERLAALAFAQARRPTNGVNAMVQRQKPSRTQPPSQLVPVQTSKVISYAHSMLSLGGVIVACIAFASSGLLIAQSDDTFRVWDDACRYPLTPWFSTKPACAVWFVNCTQMGFAGGAVDVDAALGLIHAESLVFLSMDSCPQLEMDAAVLQFRNLRAIMVRESRLMSWPVTIALSHDNFPVMQTFVLETSVLPDESRQVRGLVKGTWGETFENAFFVDTDITPLRVSDNATTWANVRGWYCVRCGIQEFPRVVFKSTLLRGLVVEGTDITAIPSPDALSSGPAVWPQLELLSLPDNPALDTISDEVWKLLTTGSLQLVRLSGTNISTIPSHILPSLSRRTPILAHGSPLCKDPAASMAIPSLVCAPPQS